MSQNWEDNKNSCPFESELTTDRTATYRIKVVGFLDEQWSDRLGGLKITSFGKEEKTVITTLTGQIIDQAALFGILKALYDMRMPLLSVDCLEIS